MTATFVNAFLEPIAHAKKKPAFIPVWNAMPLVNQLVEFHFGYCVSWEGIQVTYHPI